MDYWLLRCLWDEVVLHEFVTDLPAFALLFVIAICIFVLSKGAGWMIDGVVDLAQRTSIPRIVIGATIISLGTTMPEAFVSVMAAWLGNPGLALGNGVGSIIADTGLIFGLTCILASVPVNRFILNRTGWIQVGSATLLVFIAFMLLLFSTTEPTLGRGIGVFFLILLAAYLYITYLWAKRGGNMALEGEDESDSQPMGVILCWVMIAGGLIMVIVGARLLVPGASEIASRIGVPDDVIAATMVAFGTSLPELMTAIASVRKGHPEICVGNVVGADVLNCLFVIGAAATARPLSIPPNFFYFHFPTMLIILYSFRFFISTNIDGRFKKWQGVWLLTIYSVYIILQYTLNIGTTTG